MYSQKVVDGGSSNGWEKASDYLPANVSPRRVGDRRNAL